MSATWTQCNPRPTGLDRAWIEGMGAEAGREAAARHGWAAGAPAVVEAMVRDAGIAIVQGFGRTPEGGRPIAMVALPNGFVQLRLGATTTLAGDRETMGIALGHAALHVREGECTIVAAWPDGCDLAERRASHEAIWFMQGLLMPAEAFGATGAEAGALAARFGVTKRSTASRIEGLARRAAGRAGGDASG